MEQIEFEEEECSTFIRKTYQILDIPDFQEILCWGAEGKSFIIKDVNKFTEVVLPRFFKHTNFNSFVRQVKLNFYGFKKMKNENLFNEFMHKNFLQNRRDLLMLIKRKTCSSKRFSFDQGSESPVNISSNRSVSDLRQIRDSNCRIQMCCQNVVSQNSDLLRENIILFKNLVLTNSFKKCKLEKLISKLDEMIQQRNSQLMNDEGLPTLSQKHSSVFLDSQPYPVTDKEEVQNYLMFQQEFAQEFPFMESGEQQ